MESNRGVVCLEPRKFDHKVAFKLVTTSNHEQLRQRSTYPPAAPHRHHGSGAPVLVRRLRHVSGVGPERKGRGGTKAARIANRISLTVQRGLVDAKGCGPEPDR